MSKFLHDNDIDDDTKPIAIPWVFSKDSRAKNTGLRSDLIFYVV